ncbi:hypothetical protein C8P63_13724, partial [Melghirimyces profundicolus]
MFDSRKGEAFTQNSDFAVLPSGESACKGVQGQKLLCVASAGVCPCPQQDDSERTVQPSLQDSIARPGREATQARLVLCECIARPGREATQARLVLCECIARPGREATQARL